VVYLGKVATLRGVSWTVQVH